jgi:cation diffusion facilitator family transporter
MTATHIQPSSTKTSVAAISILASGSMALAKLVVGVAIGSLALISEALHSSIDLVATIITWAVVRVSDRPADDEHHYGHGKFESLSALGVTALLYLLAGGILVEAYGRLREGTTPAAAGHSLRGAVSISSYFWRAGAYTAPRARPAGAGRRCTFRFRHSILVIAGLILPVSASGG